MEAILKLLWMCSKWATLQLSLWTEQPHDSSICLTAESKKMTTHRNIPLNAIKNPNYLKALVTTNILHDFCMFCYRKENVGEIADLTLLKIF